jgi:hypothetical protein
LLTLQTTGANPPSLKHPNTANALLLQPNITPEKIETDPSVGAIAHNITTHQATQVPELRLGLQRCLVWYINVYIDNGTAGGHLGENHLDSHEQYTYGSIAIERIYYGILACYDYKPCTNNTTAIFPKYCTSREHATLQPATVHAAGTSVLTSYYCT